MEDRLEKIFNHFGYRTQLKKLNEEVFELIEAIRDFEEDGTKKREEHIEEEIADVYLLLSQISGHYDLDMFEIADNIDKKVERTLERIESGYYEKKRFIKCCIYGG